jgi:hypothetical protein
MQLRPPIAGRAFVAHTLIQVSFVTRPRSAPAKISCEAGRELQSPPQDALVRDNHAALGQNQFHIPKAQTEDVLEPDRVANQFGWEAVAIMRIWRPLHVFILAYAAPVRQTQLP